MSELRVIRQHVGWDYVIKRNEILRHSTRFAFIFSLL